VAEKKSRTTKRGKAVPKSSSGKARPKPRAKPKPKPKPKSRPAPRPKSEARPAPRIAAPPAAESGSKARVERIKESYALLKQFTPKELKLLLNLKRNSSTKAWTLREDLVVLTLPASNRAIAAILKGRNKEAVKKRLQLLRSKGLGKRVSESTS